MANNTAASEAARILSAQRSKYGGGRPEKLRKCRYGCGMELGARKMQVHESNCPRRTKS